MSTPLRTLLVVVGSSACLLAADLTITFKSKTKGSSEGIQTSYYSTSFHKEVNEATKTDTLVDYDKGIIYTVNHKNKKIEKITFDDLVEIAEATAKQLDQMPDFMKNMLGGGEQGEMKVEELGSDTVAGRPCKKYKLSMGKLVNEMSVDPSLKPPANPAAYAKFMKLRANTIPGSTGSSLKKLYEEMSKIKGLALKTHMTGLMGMDSFTEATDVKTSDIPASTFALPADYKIEDQGKELKKKLK